MSDLLDAIRSCPQARSEYADRRHILKALGVLPDLFDDGAVIPPHLVELVEAARAFRPLLEQITRAINGPAPYVPSYRLSPFHRLIATLPGYPRP